MSVWKHSQRDKNQESDTRGDIYRSVYELHCCRVCREDKDDQVLDYKQEIQTMEEQLRKLQKEVPSRRADSSHQTWPSPPTVRRERKSGANERVKRLFEVLHRGQAARTEEHPRFQDQ